MRPGPLLPLITRVFACLLALTSLAANLTCAGGAPRLTLQVWTADWCPPCHTFWHDYRNNLPFRKWIDERFVLRTIDFDRFHDQARKCAVDSVPAFQIFDPGARSARETITGYLGPRDLMQRLDPPPGSSAPPPPVRTPPAETSPPRPPPAPMTSSPAEQLRSEQLRNEQLRNELAAALKTEIAQAEARLLESRQTQLSHLHRDLLARLEDLSARVRSAAETTPAALARLRSELHALLRHQLPQQQQAPAKESAARETPVRASADTPRRRLWGLSLSLAQWLIVLGITGGSVPLSWGLLALGKRLRAALAAQTPPPPMARDPRSAADDARTIQQLQRDLSASHQRCRHLQQRHDRRAAAPAAGSSPTPQPAAQPSAYPAQQTPACDSPLYAPYETRIFRDAYEESCRLMARKYPGAIDTLDRLKDFINQYLSSKGQPTC